MAFNPRAAVWLASLALLLACAPPVPRNFLLISIDTLRADRLGSYGLPVDVEWAKDGYSGELYIVQARPETVHKGGSGPSTFKSRLSHSSIRVTILSVLSRSTVNTEAMNAAG